MNWESCWSVEVRSSRARTGCGVRGAAFSPGKRGSARGAQSFPTSPTEKVRSCPSMGAVSQPSHPLPSTRRGHGQTQHTAAIRSVSDHGASRHCRIGAATGSLPPKALCMFLHPPSTIHPPSPPAHAPRLRAYQHLRYFVRSPPPPLSRLRQDDLSTLLDAHQRPCPCEQGYHAQQTHAPRLLPQIRQVVL